MLTSTGIVLQPPYRNGLELSYAEADARLLFFLTYFDRILPVALNLDPGVAKPFVLSTKLEQEFVLTGNKVFQPRQFNCEGDLDNEVLADYALEAVRHANADLGGGYAFASAESSSPFLEGNAANSVVLTLERILPAPHPATALAEIQGFKAAHEAELKALHKAIEDLYYGLANRPPDEALKRFTADLNDLVAATQKAYETGGIRTYLTCLKLGLQVVGPLVLEAIGAAMGAPFIGGAMGNAVSLAVEKSKIPLLSNATPKDFQYVLSGFNEGFRAAFPDEPVPALDVVHMNIRDVEMLTYYPPSVTTPSSILGQVDLKDMHLF